MNRIIIEIKPLSAKAIYENSKDNVLYQSGFMAIYNGNTMVGKLSNSSFDKLSNMNDTLSFVQTAYTHMHTG
jgi:hypothetical protein